MTARLRTHHVLLLAIGGAALAMAACASPDVAHSVDSPSTAQASSVVIEMQSASGQSLGNCSGTLISSKMVLTAGHCIAGAKSWSVTSADKTVKASAGSTSWKAFGSDFSHPEYSDVGLIALDSEIKLSSYPQIASGAAADGAKGTRVRRASDSATTFSTTTAVLKGGASKGFRLNYLIETSDTYVDAGSPVLDSNGKIVGVISGLGKTSGMLHVARVDNFKTWTKSAVACSSAKGLRDWGSGNTQNGGGGYGGTPSTSSSGGGGWDPWGGGGSSGSAWGSSGGGYGGGDGSGNGNMGMDGGSTVPGSGGDSYSTPPPGSTNPPSGSTTTPPSSGDGTNTCPGTPLCEGSDCGEGSSGLNGGTGTSSGGADNSTSTSTSKNPDGSTTTTTKNPDGSTTTTTTNKPDGSTTTTTTKPDGTGSTSTTGSDGSTSTVTKNPDGTTTTTTTTPGGQTTTVTTNKDGDIVPNPTPSTTPGSGTPGTPESCSGSQDNSESCPKASDGASCSGSTCGGCTAGSACADYNINYGSCAACTTGSAGILK